MLGGVAPLRDDPFEAEPAGVFEYGGAVRGLDMLDELDAGMRAAQQAGERRLASHERIPAQIGPVELKQIEAEQLHLPIVPPRMQPVEVADAVLAENHALAVDDEPRWP